MNHSYRLAEGRVSGRLKTLAMFIPYAPRSIGA
jgi:hypothetical protein